MAFRQPQDKPKIQSKAKGVRNSKRRQGSKIVLELYGNESSRGKITDDDLIRDTDSLADMGTRVFVRPKEGLMRRPSGSKKAITHQSSNPEGE